MKYTGHWDGINMGIFRHMLGLMVGYKVTCVVVKQAYILVLHAVAQHNRCVHGGVGNTL